MYHRYCLAALALAPLAFAARADDYARYLPSNTKAVYLVNVSAMSDADQKQAAEFVRQLYRNQIVPELKKLDELPVSDLERIVVAQPYAGDMRGVVLLRGKVDAKLLDKQVRDAAKLRPRTITVVTVGKPGVNVFGREVNQKELQALFPPLGQLDKLGFAMAAAVRVLMPGTVHVAALDDKTLMLSLSGSLPVERAAKKRDPKAAPSFSAPELKKLLADLDAKDVADVVLTEDCLAPGLQLAGPKEVNDWFSRLSHAVGRVEGGKTVKMTMTAKAKTKGDAARLEKDTAAVSKLATDSLSKALDADQQKAVKALVEGVKVTRKDDVVTIFGEASEEDGKRLLPLFQKK